MEFNEENERLTVGFPVVVKTLNLEISPYRFRRLRLTVTILLKYLAHVQHDYFSSFNQSDHLFSGVIFATAIVLA